MVEFAPLVQNHFCVKFIEYFMASLMPINVRGGSRAAGTSKIECFVIIVNGWKPLIIITKRSILDVSAALDPPLKVH